MPHLPPSFYIYDGEKEILVSQDVGSNENCFIVHLDEREVKLRSEGIKKKLWIEQGKGATPLAFTLGKLIESRKNLNEQKLL
ncbi:MAG: hypothetical protein M3040_15795 [Bacteroidota bacterium]|nr:hypothetical protein [Bacteroidota bacterium]